MRKIFTIEIKTDVIHISSPYNDLLDDFYIVDM